MNSETDQAERREYVRTPFKTQAKVEIIEQVVEAEVAEKGLDTHSLGDIAENIYNTSGLNDPAMSVITDMLIQLDEKLNRILRILNDESVRNELEVKETVDISGSGVRLRLDTKLNEGQVIKVTLRIPGFPMGLLRVHGQVVRVSPVDNGALYEIGIRFLDLSAGQKEALIAYTFFQQRKSIRQSRENGD